MPKPDYHLLDVTALRQLLAKRVEDWKPISLTSIIQAGINTAADHMDEWYIQAQRIHARKTETGRQNAAYARKIKLTRKDKTK